MAFQLKDKSRIYSDLTVFLIGFGVAWWVGWQTVDLIWSLWLSSLLIGYATISGSILYFVAGKVDLPDKSSVESLEELPPIARLPVGLFHLGFFSVHFIGFHAVHAFFLFALFPLDGLADFSLEGLEELEILARRAVAYLPFVAIMAIGERDRIKQSVKKFDLAGPYLNVVRMHLLIFFFGFTAFLGADHIFVFAVVYVVYFSPWAYERKK